MSIEIEAKLKVASHDAVRAKLAALGAECVGRVLETNYIFDSADRKLLAADAGLRVRTYHTEDGRCRPATLTFKGPRQDTALKSREQRQTSVSDAEAAIGILAALGFVEAVRFEKRRETWRYGSCKVELDELPYLGCYVEIEGPDEQAIRQVQEALELGELNHEPESYIALLVGHCRHHGLPTVPIRFEEA